MENQFDATVGMPMENKNNTKEENVKMNTKTELEVTLHNMLKVVDDKKVRTQLIALASHIQNKGYDVDAGTFARYAAAIGGHEFTKIIARVDEIHSVAVTKEPGVIGKVQSGRDYIMSWMFGKNDVIEKALSANGDLDKDHIKVVVKRLTEQMKAANVDVLNEKAVMAYVASNMESIVKMFNELEEKANHDLEKQFGECWKELKTYVDSLTIKTDYIYYRAVQVFRTRGENQKLLADAIYAEVGNTEEAVGKFIRKRVAERASVKEIAKTTVYLTGDTTRSVGDATEWTLDKTGELIHKGLKFTGNGTKLLLHAIANIVEAPIGGRPEEIKDVNMVNEFFKKATKTADKKSDKK